MWSIKRPSNCCRFRIRLSSPPATFGNRASASDALYLFLLFYLGTFTKVGRVFFVLFFCFCFCKPLSNLVSRGKPQPPAGVLPFKDGERGEGMRICAHFSPPKRCSCVGVMQRGWSLASGGTGGIPFMPLKMLCCATVPYWCSIFELPFPYAGLQRARGR